MNFTFGLDYKNDDFKKLMGYLKNAPLLFYPYFLTQPASAAGLEDTATIAQKDGLNNLTQSIADVNQD